MIVPAPAGGQTDVLARLLAQKMQQALGQSVIIDNRAGAGGALGARAAAAAEPDGYTLFFGNTSTLAVIPAVSKNAGYDPVKNFAPVASVSESYMILVCTLVPGEDVAGVSRLRQGQSRQAQFRPCRRRQRDAPHRRDVPHRWPSIDFVNVPHKGGAESITGVLGQQVDFAVGKPGGPAAADPRGQAARARGDQREAAGGDRRRPDHGRERRDRLRGDAADRRRGAGRHAGGRSSASSTA